jgi:EAL domain-containing protein (putative c-di-GMP-specific phosphodiesterase class I)
MVMISRAINLELSSQKDFLVLDKVSQGDHRLAKVRDGLFAALIISQQSAQQDDDYRRIQAVLSQGAQVSELYIALSAYFGISSYSAHDDEKKLDVMKQAQQALDQAKREITAIARYQSNHAYSLAQRLSLAANLQQALRDNKLQLYHQPQIDLQTGLVDGSEVLLRWHHDEFGNIPPDEFIPIAEDTGMVNELTLWVIERACQHLEILMQQGYEAHNVSVNISGKDIAEPGFLHNVRGILSRYKVPLYNLTFELTESVTVSDFHLLKQTLDELTRMGINIAIDDYGTGYSSLFYISQLPFTELKIDKSFVADLDVSERHRTIVKTTIEMAKSLNLRLVAEGIESASIEALLREQDCHIAQGYYYQRPIPFSQYLTWLQTWRQD